MAGGESKKSNANAGAGQRSRILFRCCSVLLCCETMLACEDVSGLICGTDVQGGKRRM